MAGRSRRGAVRAPATGVTLRWAGARVAIARALAADPDVRLLDETFAALDVAVAPQLRMLLREVLRGRTALLVTHDLVDVVTLADRAVVLDHGRIVEDRPVRELVESPRSRFAAELAGQVLLEGTLAGSPTRLPGSSNRRRGRSSPPLRSCTAGTRSWC